MAISHLYFLLFFLVPSQIEDQMDALQRTIQKRISELEPGKLRAYNDLLARQHELQDRALQSENKLNDVNGRIRQYESDDKANFLRKEFLNLERTFQSLRKETESLKEELEIANMDPKEALAKFVARVNNFKQDTKSMEDKAAQLREEISQSRKNLDDLSSNLEEDSGEAAKYELLVKRDQDMTAFMDSFDDQRQSIVNDKQNTQYIIVAALEHISKGLDATENMPNQEGMSEMENAKTFKEKNLATAQRTMENLLAEKKKREKEIDLLRTSEPKLLAELSSLREHMSKMQAEMDEFENIDHLRHEFEGTQLKLQDARAAYIKRRDTMKHQVQTVSMEYEAIKKTLNAHDIAREIDDTEKRLKHYERSIFELREFVDTKSRETDYEGVKANCLKLVDSANSYAIKNANGTLYGGMR
jgi:intraflagellar transport protein 74